jgi:23S rRNA pseudouridine1911/1915/1917 synthase
VGDPLYGEPRWKGIADPAVAAVCKDFPRQALHACRLSFLHPATGAPLEIVAPVPEDMAALLAAAGL